MDRCLPNNKGTGWTNQNMSFMGLSMRTDAYRYTEWHAWLGGDVLKVGRLEGDPAWARLHLAGALPPTSADDAR